MKKKKRLLIVATEPAPYKIDLFNAFVDSGEWEPMVFYSKSKDWSPDAGHDFRELPCACFDSRIINGRTLISTMRGVLLLAKLFKSFKPDFSIICGYIGVLPIVALIICVATRHPYAMWADWFNNEQPEGWRILSAAVRRLLRKIVFSTATLIMMCGREGIASAIRAGCSSSKVINFPYVVDFERLSASNPARIPAACLNDYSTKKTIILFSGRLIPRKGLALLLNAVSLITNSEEWVLWIEGDGPLSCEYMTLGEKLGLADRCRFLGFCQMQLHGWLLSHADIIVVPSLHDPWGIVVDEGMQMGKVVCASSGACSALDRIIHGKNGFLFDTADTCSLSNILSVLLSRKDLRETLGLEARRTASHWTPKSNIETFTYFLGVKK